MTPEEEGKLEEHVDTVAEVFFKYLKEAEGIVDANYPTDSRDARVLLIGSIAQSMVLMSRADRIEGLLLAVRDHTLAS
jgi:hypothetical protein